MTWLFGVGLWMQAGNASAFEPFALQVPCRATAMNSVGTVRPCITCHNNPDGGGGCDAPPCFNPFGSAFNANGRVWDDTLAMLDSDGDGYSNGIELGDPTGTWRVGDAEPATCGCATRPGFATFTPADVDADSDGYCCWGRDVDGDGDCLDADEQDDVSFDCDDADAMVHTGRAEVCTNTIDNDCDGLPTLLDDECANVVDRDGDGYCPMGVDLNRDRGCIDAGEMTADVDCDDSHPTVNPAAREFCIDALDNDCDGDIDLDDSECTNEEDADSDGFCPIGRDLNNDGDCKDAGETDGVSFDCDDSNPAANPAATEICTDGADNDCDGLVDFRDRVDCGALFDADGDGYCPDGRDGNGNGNCADPGETDEPGDCDDTNPAINPGMAEVCTNADVDDDCDGYPSLADDDCAGYIDGDHDTYCYVGVDMDGDGFCVSDGEQNGRGDCDETRDDVNPSVEEVCTDGIDNDCNGTIDAADRVACFEYRDHDGDGYCWVGQDLNRDQDCSDADEQGDLREWRADEDPHSAVDGMGTEFDPTRYPGAPEHCGNQKDDDLDGSIDESEYCRRDVDADGDGWCPVGRDLNGDGDCEDEGENVAAFDCNDMADDVNPGQEERCTEPVDADCDGYVGVADADCFHLLDRDGDGVCGRGVDDNGDADCLDDGEQRFGVDCDDRDPTVSNRAREVCGDGIDNDCNGDIDYADRVCSCEAAEDCDDGDACTVDTCNPDGTCGHAPSQACADGGMPDAGMGTDENDDCNCTAVGVGRSAGLSLACFALVGVALWWRRRRNGVR